MPTHCPRCCSPVKRKEGEVANVCSNRDCFAQQVARLLHFVGRAAFDIRGLGDRIAEQLVQKGLVSEYADLFALAPDDLLALEGFADLSAHKLVKEIQAHREIALDRFIYALGIRHVGEETAADLARTFGSWEAFQHATREALLAREGVGDVMAAAIVDFLRDDLHREEIARLLQYVTVKDVLRARQSGPFADTAWVLTGTLSSLTREEAKEKIRALGGDISETVSKKTSYVVVGEQPGSKADKARKIGVTVLDEQAFLKKLF